MSVRETFSQSRSMEYFSEAELVRQCGHTRPDWPLVVVKEVIDDSLDACESASIQPKITISVDERQLVITDNGPGLPAAVVRRILDFNTRTSDKAAYVSPSRGTMGNGLKLVMAIPFVLNEHRSTTILIEACGIRHTIDIDTDQVRNEPKIGHREEEIVRTEGTTIRIPCDSPWSQDVLQDTRFLQLICDFALFNPHADFTVFYYGQECVQPASAPIRKWTPAEPTSPHWYEDEDLANLIRSHIAADEMVGHTRSVREFVATFCGLKGTAKQQQVTTAAGLERNSLRDLLDDQNKLRRDAVQRLLIAMQDASAPVKPDRLGILGEEHFRRHMSDGDGDDATFRYKRISGDVLGRPYMIEAAFIQTSDSGLQIGINSSVPLSNPLQQCWLGDQAGLSALLTKQRVNFSGSACDEEQTEEEEDDDGDGDPVCVLLHLCCPRFAFTDQGKGSIKLPAKFGNDVATAISYVTQNWTKLKKAEERSLAAADKLIERLNRRQDDRHVTVKNAAYLVMEAAHLHARGDKPAPVSPRQVMYAARPKIVELTGRQLDDKYFTQTLLPDFMQEHPKLTEDWDIVWDDRGHLTEPHTGQVIGLGTVGVREYLANWNGHVYGTLLIIEKEGFTELLRAARFQERYDMAIMSSKGMSTTAARTVIERCSCRRVKILCLHDFDVSGLSIMATTTRNTRRYEFESEPEVIDLGLRLSDVRELGLQSEEVEINFDPTNNLLLNGATEEEVEFLRGTRMHRQDDKKRFKARRVELNAMTNPQFVAWLDRKLSEHDVQKVIPEESMLQDEFREHVKQAKIQSRLREIEKEVARDMESFTPPEGLRRKVAEEFKRDNALSWKDAIGALSL